MDTLLELIGSGFGNALNFLLGILAQFLPQSTGFSPDFLGSISKIMGFGYQLGFIVPWTAIFNAMIIGASFNMGLFTMKVSIKIIKIIRGGG